MSVSLHGMLGYTAAGLLLIALVVGVVPWWRRFGSAGRWLVVGAGCAVLPLVTTGVVAHCERVWRAAGVESSPPNLAWYRLVRDAAAVAPAGGAGLMPWHGWLGVVVAAAVVGVGGWARDRAGRWTYIASGALATVGLAVLVTGYVLSRRASFSPGFDAQSMHGSMFAHALLLGLALSSAVMLIGLTLRADAKPGSVRLAAIVCGILVAAAVAAGVWQATGWQLSRVPGLVRQPRDVAQVVSGVCAVAATVGVAWTTRRRWRVGLVGALVVFLALYVWFAALILYDGSHRGSPVWGFQRPFVQGRE